MPRGVPNCFASHSLTSRSVPTQPIGPHAWSDVYMRLATVTSAGGYQGSLNQTSTLGCGGTLFCQKPPTLHTCWPSKQGFFCMAPKPVSKATTFPATHVHCQSRAAWTQLASLFEGAAACGVMSKLISNVSAVCMVVSNWPWSGCRPTYGIRRFSP